MKAVSGGQVDEVISTGTRIVPDNPIAYESFNLGGGGAAISSNGHESYQPSRSFPAPAATPAENEPQEDDVAERLNCIVEHTLSGARRGGIIDAAIGSIGGAAGVRIGGIVGRRIGGFSGAIAGGIHCS